MKKITAGILAMMMGMGTAASVHAQGNPATQTGMPQTEQSLPSASFSEAEIRTFVSLQQDLEQIRAQFTERLHNAQDPDKAAQLQQDANLEMVEVVESSGISVETYNEIAMALQTDPQLRDQVESMIN